AANGGVLPGQAQDLRLLLPLRTAQGGCLGPGIEGSRYHHPGNGCGLVLRALSNFHIQQKGPASSGVQGLFVCRNVSGKKSNQLPVAETPGCSAAADTAARR